PDNGRCEARKDRRHRRHLQPRLGRMISVVEPNADDLARLNRWQELDRRRVDVRAISLQELRCDVQLSLPGTQEIVERTGIMRSIRRQAAILARHFEGDAHRGVLAVRYEFHDLAIHQGTDRALTCRAIRESSFIFGATCHLGPEKSDFELDGVEIFYDLGIAVSLDAEIIAVIRLLIDAEDALALARCTQERL